MNTEKSFYVWGMLGFVSVCSDYYEHYILTIEVYSMSSFIDSKVNVCARYVFSQGRMSFDL